LESDSFCALGHILFIFDACRTLLLPIGKSHYQNQLQTSLQAVDKMFDVLTPREKYLKYALDRWLKGEYDLAGNILEDYILKTNSGHDTLVLKLCQESYVLAGNKTDTLMCILRSGFLCRSDNILHGDILAMLSFGYCEVGRWSDAERIGEKALQMTKGRSTFALSSLLNTLLLQGRASEAYGLVHQYESKHNDDGRLEILYAGACAKYLRGEYGASVSYLHQLEEWMNKNYITKNGLINISLISWLFDLSLEYRKDVAILTLKNIKNVDSFDPIVSDRDSTYRTMMGLLSFPSKRRYDHITAPIAGDGLSGEQRMLKRLFGAGKTNKSREENQSKIIHADLDLNFDYEKAMAKYRENSDMYQSSLFSMKHVLQLLQSFSEEDYKQVKYIYYNYQESNEKFYFSEIPNSWSRHIFLMTSIEGLIRNEDYDLVKYILGERSVIAPSDGQIWWRLAAVIHEIGPKDKENYAHFQAKLLGIGQGGFKVYKNYPLQR
jgi:hypothetical protein